MSTFLRRELPLSLATFVGIMMVFEYYFRTTLGSVLAAAFRNIAVVATSWTFILAFVVTSIRHVKLSSQGRGLQRYYSMLLIAMLWGMTLMGLVLGPRYTWYVWLFNNINPIVYGAMIGTTCFFVASAGYRALRIRSMEGTLMLIVGVIVMLSQVTVGEVIWGGMGPLGNWLMEVAQASSTRGLEITIGFGFVAMCMRILSWMDARWMGE
jgi:hypothetical protein